MTKNFVLVIKKFIKKTKILRVIFLWALFFAIQITVLLIKWNDLPPEIPLFYSKPWGKQQIAYLYHILILPLSLVMASAVNYFLAFGVYKKEPLLAKILIWTTVLLSLITVISIIKIVFLIS